MLEWGRNLSSFTPRISSAGLAGLQVIRGYNQELAQTIYGIALARRTSTSTNLVERLGSSAMELLDVVGPQGDPARRRSTTRWTPAVLAKSMLANLLEGMYEGTGSCIGIPDLAAGDYVAIRGVGQALQRHLPGAQGDPPDRRQRLSHRASRSPSAATPACWACCASRSPRSRRRTRPSASSASCVGEVVDNNEIDWTCRPRCRSGRVKVSYPGLSADDHQRLGALRAADGRQGYGLLRAARGG